MSRVIEIQKPDVQKPKDIKVLLRATIPFLRQLPDRIYTKLDTSEFYVPSGEVAKARIELENELGQHVMTYKRDIFNSQIPLDAHLCANIAGARLTPEQLKTLSTYEARFTDHGVNFVVYKKPLTLINPEVSAMGKYYKSLGLMA